MEETEKYYFADLMVFLYEVNRECNVLHIPVGIMNKIDIDFNNLPNKIISMHQEIESDYVEVCIAREPNPPFTTTR